MRTHRTLADKHQDEALMDLKLAYRNIRAAYLSQLQANRHTAMANGDLERARALTEPPAQIKTAA